MAFKTFSTGDVLTANDVNAYLAKQAVIVCTSATRPGSPVEGMHIYQSDTNSLLVYSGSAWTVVWYLTRPMAQMRQTGVQSVADSTWTSLTFTAEDFDTVGGHSTSVNTSRYTCQVAGYYELTGGVAFSATSTGTAWGRWAKNGTEVNASASNMVNTTTQMFLPARTILVSLAVSDYVELQAWQSTGSALFTYTADAYAASSMTVKWVSP